MNLAKEIGKALIGCEQTISVAESCSGGLLGHRLTNIAGSSKYFHGGVIVYSNAMKTQLLNIAPQLIKQEGAVSSVIATKMAQAVRKLLKTHWGISITGIAGPGGKDKEKPVGLIYVAVANFDHVVCRKYLFKGSRLKIKTLAAQAALDLALKIIRQRTKVLARS